VKVEPSGIRTVVAAGQNFVEPKLDVWKQAADVCESAIFLELEQLLVTVNSEVIRHAEHR
jgi:hypothetical protein